jgi:hypothetical protein
MLCYRSSIPPAYVADLITTSKPADEPLLDDAVLLWSVAHGSPSSYRLIHVVGIYVVLFILAIFTLSRRKTRGRYVLLVASWVMFPVATTVLIMDVSMTAISVRIVQNVAEDPGSGPTPDRVQLFVALGCFIIRFLGPICAPTPTPTLQEVGEQNRPEMKVGCRIGHKTST